MRRITPVILLFFALFTGCINKNMNKQEYYNNGLEFLEKENARGAMIAFKKAIEIDHNYFEARYQLALAYIIQKKYDSAEKELFKVLRLNPSLNDVHLSLAKIHINSGKFDDALKETDLYLLEKKNNPEVYELAAIAHTAKKDYVKSAEILNKTIQMFPDRIPTKVILAEVYFADGKIYEAESVIGNILEMDKENKKALYFLARIKHEQGNADAAINIYQKILEIDPEDIIVQFQVGLMYLWK